MKHRTRMPGSRRSVEAITRSEIERYKSLRLGERGGTASWCSPPR